MALKIYVYSCLECEGCLRVSFEAVCGMKSEAGGVPRQKTVGVGTIRKYQHLSRVKQQHISPAEQLRIDSVK